MNAGGRPPRYFFLLLILSFCVTVFGMPRLGVKVIRALTVTLPFSRSFCLASLVRRSFTEIAGGPPEALEGLSRSFLFFFAVPALSGAAASETLTVPAD